MRALHGRKTPRSQTVSQNNNATGVPPLPPPDNNLQGVSGLFKKFYKLILLLGAIFTVWIGLDFACNKMKSQKELDREAKLPQGEFILPQMKIDSNDDNQNFELPQTLISPGIVDKADSDSFPHIRGILVHNYKQKKHLRIIFGDTVYYADAKKLQTGITISAGGACGEHAIRLGLYNDRIYISTEFKDLMNGNFVGEINYNKWKLFKENFLDYDNSDESLVVFDKRNNIIFDMICFDQIDDDIILAIRGYFMSPFGVMVVNTDPFNSYRKCIPITGNSDWQRMAQLYCQRIPKVFFIPYNFEAIEEGKKLRVWVKRYSPKYLENHRKGNHMYAVQDSLGFYIKVE